MSRIFYPDAAPKPPTRTPLKRIELGLDIFKWVIGIVGAAIMVAAIVLMATSSSAQAATAAKPAGKTVLASAVRFANSWVVRTQGEQPGTRTITACIGPARRITCSGSKSWLVLTYKGGRFAVIGTSADLAGSAA